MPNNGSSTVAGLAYFAGNPSSADLKAFDEPAGTVVIDLTSGALRQKKAAQGTNVDGYSDVFTGITNSAAGAQNILAADGRKYIVGSNVAITAGRIAVGTLLRWRFGMTKTGAGSATSTIDIAFGTAGTTADTARVSFTKPAGTAHADEGFVEIEATVTAVGATTGVVTGEFRMIHNHATQGHMTIPAACVLTTSSAFNTSTVTDIGLCLTTGASDDITIGICTVEAINL
jgi:hypothetical protein